MASLTVLRACEVVTALMFTHLDAITMLLIACVGIGIGLVVTVLRAIWCDL